jgi:hypothetical protein
MYDVMRSVYEYPNSISDTSLQDGIYRNIDSVYSEQ